MDYALTPQDEAPGLSVVLPVFHERDTVRTAIVQLIQLLREHTVTFEVIAVDDGSTDGTHEVLQQLACDFPKCVRVITHSYNKGMGASVRTGIASARGEIVACMDADGQHDPQDIFRMLPFMDAHELVVGARSETYQGAWHRNLANKCYNALASWLAAFKVEDLTSGYRLFRASTVRKYLALFPKRFSYSTTTTLLFLKAGYSVKYVPIHVRPRQGGSSKISVFGDGWGFTIIILKIIVLLDPLRVFLPVATVSFLLALMSILYSTISFGRPHVANSAVVLFMMGIIVTLLGLISEQIAAMQLLLRDNSDR